MPTPFDPFIQQVAKGWNLAPGAVMQNPAAAAEVQRLAGAQSPRPELPSSVSPFSVDWNKASRDQSWMTSSPFGGYQLGGSMAPGQADWLNSWRNYMQSELTAAAGERNAAQFTGSYRDPQSNLVYMPHADGWQVYQGGDAMDSHDKSVLNGRPAYTYDASGNLVNQGTLQGLTKTREFGPLASALAIAFGGPAVGSMLAAAPAAGGAITGSAGSSTLAGGAAADTLAAGAASSGTGLTAGGGLGLSASPGAGLALSAPSTGLGITAGSAGAGTIGAGLGTSGLAAGSGSLLGAAALNGAGGAGGAFTGQGLTPPTNALGNTGGSAAPPAPPKSGMEKALSSLGLTPQQVKDFAPVALALMASSGGGGGSAPTSNPAEQAASAKTFLEAVLPYIRVNSANPAGSSQWTRNPDGTYNLTSSLAGDQAGGFNTANSKFAEFLGGVNPNAQAPDLIDSTRGQYSEDLAKAIYDRTYGLQANSIDEQRRALEARLVEQGFVTGNEGYSREMNRFEDNLGELRQGIARDAQIQASRQALDEANFTNTSRTQGFRNTQDLQQQIATILAGARTNYLAPLKDLSSASNAPSGSPANAADIAQNAFTNDLALQSNRNQTRNDLMKALLQWGLA